MPTDEQINDRAASFADEVARLRDIVGRTALALGGAWDEDPIELAKKRMGEIAVYECETERQLSTGLNTLSMPKGGPPPEAFRNYAEQLNEMPLVKSRMKNES